MRALYPAFLKLDGLRVVVVGGGPVAAGKLDALVAANARVILISPEICDAIRARRDIVRTSDIGSAAGTSAEFKSTNNVGEINPATDASDVSARDAHTREVRALDSATDDPSRDIQALEVPPGHIVLVERGFLSPDLDGARWVVAAAPPHVNQQVAAAATARGLFVNAVDDTSAASAYLGGVVRRGDVEIAISTGGAAPALAGLLREAIDALIPADIARWVDVAKQARVEWKRERVPMGDRRPRLLRALVELYRSRDVDARFDHAPIDSASGLIDGSNAGGLS